MFLVHGVVRKSELFELVSRVLDALAVRVFATNISTVLWPAVATVAGSFVDSRRALAKNILGDECEIPRWFFVIDAVNDRE